MRQRRQRRRTLLRILAGAVCLAMFLPPLLAGASIEEQRRRLPPPARDCQDPVTGWWQGHQVTRGTWYRFTLDVKRIEPGSEELEGSIESLFWDRDVDRPPPCDGNDHDQIIVDMPAKGSFIDNRIEFIGQSWKLRKVVCGSMLGSYAPDGFSGKLILENTEFHTENDDGVNPIATVVFRRIKCGDEPKPIPDLPPPAPRNFNTGCGCF